MLDNYLTIQIPFDLQLNNNVQNTYHYTDSRRFHNSKWFVFTFFSSLTFVVYNQETMNLTVSTQPTPEGVDPQTGRVEDKNFLREKLPIKVIRILPAPSVEGQRMLISGPTAITIVFNRAVIALGSDFGAYNATTTKELMELDRRNQTLQMPFVFEGLPDEGVKVRFRWVTTSICRVDPIGDWPTDLDFTVRVKQVTSLLKRLMISI